MIKEKEKDQKITFRIDVESKRELKRQSKKAKMSVSKIIRIAIKEYFNA